ncbi:hypothetical protein INT44_003467 [Umbelopsis vinacea]|uniref:Uncharacterized protein n=1 Tax=Umbelopsis vinacea TaxID=44442 RepID=A0A8H7PV73_9FUNG|nr:hypothetical protein INT44_003467 [Umbelopsis vinacea]
MLDRVFPWKNAMGDTILVRWSWGYLLCAASNGLSFLLCNDTQKRNASTGAQSKPRRKILCIYHEAIEEQHPMREKNNRKEDR